MTTLVEIGLTNAVLSALLAVVVLAITRLWRNPHLAHVLWIIVLVKLVTPPLVSLPVALGFDWEGPRGESATSAPLGSTPPVVASGDVPGNDVAVNWADELPEDRALAATQVLREGPIEEPAAVPSRALDAWSVWPLGVGILWLTGSAVIALIAVVRIAKFHRLVKQAELAGDSVQKLGNSVAKTLGLRRCPALRITAGQIGPMVWPVGSPPTVVLPSGLMEELEEEQLRTILAHEFGHIARRDGWVRWLELVCTVLYWWNPCLWFARREIRVSEELCCDALVLASHPGCSRSLGESLLKAHDFMSGAAFRPLLLVSEMRGRGELSKRIEMIAKGRSSRRLSPATRGLVFLAALGILPLYAQEPQNGNPIAEAPEVADIEAVTLADIVAGLAANERALETLVVNCRTEATNNVGKPGSGPPPKNMIEDDAARISRAGTISWEVTRDGRGRMTAKYTKTNTRFDGSQKTKTEEYVSTYDGNAGHFLTIVSSPTGIVTQRSQRPTDRFMTTSPSPFDFTTQQLGNPISSLLSDENCKIIGIEEWEDRPVAVVEAAPVSVRDDYIYKQQFWIDTQRNYLVVRRQSYVQRGEGKPWALHYQIDTRKHASVAPGIWLPATIDILNYHVTMEGQDYLVSREHIEASDWSVNKVLDATRFELQGESISQVGQPIGGATDPGPRGKVPAQPDSKTEEDKTPAGFRNMLVTTVDEQGEIVPQVGIYVSIWPEGEYKTLKRSYTTDDEGQATVLVPDPPRLFRLWTRKPGYVPLFAQWWPQQQTDGHLVPEKFKLTLPPGTVIGGTIVDEAGKPIAGATVEVALGNRVDEMGRRPVPSMWLAEVPGPGNNPSITDAEGRWRLDTVSAGDEIFVRVKVTHPNYVSDTNWGGLQTEQEVPMSAFRDKSASIAMQRGIVLSGRVTDTQGEPVADALVVWGDDPYLQEGSQEVRTDAEGIYRLHPLNPGEMNVTVVAEGWSPVMKTVDIQSADATEDFELSKGRLLLVEFLDEAGNPIPNVGVGVRGWRRSQSLYNHKHPNVLDSKIPTKSDSEGIFEWQWAPDDAVDYALYAEGYRTVERTLTADDSIQSVILTK